LPKDSGAECRSGFGLHAGHDVLIDGHREGDAAVTEPFADDLGVNVLLEENCGVSVAKVVQPDPR